jgi:hypothetical protein
MLTYALQGPGLGILPSSISQYIKPATTTAPAPTALPALSWGSVIKKAVQTLPIQPAPPQPPVPTGNPMMPQGTPIVAPAPTNGAAATSSPTAVATDPSAGVVLYQTPWYESTGGRIGLVGGGLLLLGTLGYFAFGR